jgi:CheY-like chemotaxis protein
MPGKQPTILVVDDDDDVRFIAVETLTTIGYDVVEASNGADALRMIAAIPRIAVLFTDVVMPGMDGIVLAHEARKARPDITVLYSSGYIKNFPPGKPGIGYCPLIDKPWKAERLKQMIEQVAPALGGAGSRPER